MENGKTEKVEQYCKWLTYYVTIMQNCLHNGTKRERKPRAILPSTHWSFHGNKIIGSLSAYLLYFNPFTQNN